MENFNAGKESSPEQMAIIMERGVIEKYAPLLESEPPSTQEEAKLKWIDRYGKSYRKFFDEHRQELIELYKRDPDRAIDYIETEIEGTA